MSTSVSKIVAERNRRILLEHVLKPGNDICADCKARAPRWASHNLGIFICVNCASIHRKIGTHVTKVKSITLDEWSKEQVEVIKQNGNLKSNALYNPNEARHPPPTNMMDSERDSELEKYIRSKYEFKRFMDRKSSATTQAVSTAVRSHSTPLPDILRIERKASPGPPLPPKTPENLPKGLRYSSTIPSLPQNPLSPTRSVSQPLSSLTVSDKLSAAAPLKQSEATQSTIQDPPRRVWEELISLQGPSQSSSLPLQYNPIAPFPPQQSISVQQPFINAPNPFTDLSLGQAASTIPFVTSQQSASTLGRQLPLIHPALPSPAHRLETTSPFNRAQALPSPVGSFNNTGIPANSNPFFPTIPMVSLSAPATPSMQPVAALPTGPFQTPPLSYAVSHTPPSASTPSPSSPFIPAAVPPTPGVISNPFTPIGTPGQIALSTGSTTNPFSTMQVGQAGFPRESPQPEFGAPMFVGQQHYQPLGTSHGFSIWTEQGTQGTF